MASRPPPALKRWGQHFLIDPNIVRKIVALAAVQAHEVVLEIGPGRGALTAPLCASAGRVIAIEIDPMLHTFLMNSFREVSNLELLCADALTYDYTALPSGTVVVGNLPYYISTPLLMTLLDAGSHLDRMVLTLQREVAQRLVARPGSRDYGALSVMAQYASEMRTAFHVSPSCFRPRPEVGSTVVQVTLRPLRGLPSDREPSFKRLVRAAFAHRRKTLANALRDEGYPTMTTQAALRRCGLPLNCRAETLEVDQYARLAEILTETKSGVVASTGWSGSH